MRKNLMNDKIKELAERAGFQLWQDEEWNPGDVIDWSCRYDDELEKFAELLIERCAEVADEYVRPGDFDIATIIKQHFRR
jgi:hypothetical protein